MRVAAPENGCHNPAVEVWSTVVAFLSFDPARLAEPDMIVRLGVQVMLLCCSAFFSGSETALFSLSNLDLQQLRRAGHPQAGPLQELLDEPRRLIVSLLCGNELVNIAAVANMTGILVALYGEARAGWIAVCVMLPLLLLVGEVTPKTIAVANPRRLTADLIARPMSAWVSMVAPLRWVIRIGADRITTWIVGPARSPDHLLQIDEFKSLIDDFAEAGRLQPSSRVLITNLLEAGTTEIVTIMTPRSRTAFLDGSQRPAELVERFRKIRHWRVPVYRGHRDNLLGFVCAEDVLRLLREGADLDSLSAEDLVRPPIVVPLTKKIDEMFDFFRRNEARAAMVLNEFGGVAGVVTLNDVLRFIVGPITTPATRESEVKQVAPDVYEAPGDTRLAEFNRVTNFGIQDPRMTTIAGVAFRQIDRLPKVGDRAQIESFVIEVLAMDEHRISRVRVARGAPPLPPSEPAPPPDPEAAA